MLYDCRSTHYSHQITRNILPSYFKMLKMGAKIFLTANKKGKYIPLSDTNAMQIET